MATRTFILFLVLSFFNVFCLVGKEKAETSKVIKATVSLLVGFPFVSQSKEFSDVYKIHIGGKNDYYRPSALMGGRLQVELTEKLDIGFMAEQFSVSLRDRFLISTNYFDDVITRQFNEKIDVTQSPLLVFTEYTSSRVMYNSYIGFALGMSYDKIYWLEEINSNLGSDMRRTSEIYNGTQFSPATKLYTGVKLNFDKKSNRDFLGVISFEASFNYIYRSIKIFEKLNEQYSTKVEAYTNKYFFLNNYITLTAGISFNLYPEIKN